MSWKKFIVGEPMPDKNDPRYKDRYEREVAAGERFARAVGVSWFARTLQQWGQSHKVAFLVLVFGLVISCFFINAYRLVMMYRQGSTTKAVAVERVDSALSVSRHHSSMDVRF